MKDKHKADGEISEDKYQDLKEGADHKHTSDKKRLSDIMTRIDIIIISILIIVGIMLTGWIYLPVSSHEKSKNAYLIVEIDGKEVDKLSLYKDVVRTYADDGHTNTLEIKNGSVRMTDADCPDRTCIRMGAISDDGETIVCLPHKLILRIYSDSVGADAISG